ncbi:MAG: DMT family transporter [Anaerolineales bacterium]
MSNTLLYLITVIIWGSTWLVITFQLGSVPPELSVAYRFALASLILFVYIAARRLPARFSLKQHAFFALQGLFLFSLNYILVYLAESTLTSGLVAIVFSTIIVFNVVFGTLFLRNPVRLRVILGGTIGLLGLGLVFWPELTTLDLSSERAVGLLLAFLATISASLGNIISARNQRSELPVVQTNAYGMAYGAMIMFVLALLRGAPLTFDPSSEYIFSLLYLALFGSVIAFGTYLTLLGKIGPDRAAYVTVAFPIIALALSTIFEGLTWTLLQIGGVLLVIAGNVIVLRRRGGRELRRQRSEETRMQTES